MTHDPVQSSGSLMAYTTQWNVDIRCISDEGQEEDGSYISKVV